MQNENENEVKSMNTFHRFFYDNAQLYGRRRARERVYYEDFRFYSYSTAIAQSFEKNGKTYLICADKNFSQTTSKHLRNLKAACPPDIEQIEAPFYFNCYCFDFDFARKKIEVCLNAGDLNLSARCLREEFKKYFICAQKLNATKLFKKILIKNKWKKTFETILNFENNLISRTEINLKIAKKQKSIENKKLRENRYKIKKIKSAYEQVSEALLSSGEDFLQIVEKAYGVGLKNILMTKEEQDAARLLRFNLQGGEGWERFDYLFVENYKNTENKVIKTTRGVQVPAEKVIPVLKTFVENFEKNIETQGLVSQFKIFKSTGYEIKIGCHRFNAHSIIALANRLGVIDLQKYHELTEMAIADASKEDFKIIETDKHKLKSKLASLCVRA